MRRRHVFKKWMVWSPYFPLIVDPAEQTRCFLSSSEDSFFLVACRNSFFQKCSRSPPLSSVLRVTGRFLLKVVARPNCLSHVITRSFFFPPCLRGPCFFFPLDLLLFFAIVGRTCSQIFSWCLTTAARREGIFCRVNVSNNPPQKLFFPRFYHSPSWNKKMPLSLDRRPFSCSNLKASIPLPDPHAPPLSRKSILHNSPPIEAALPPYPFSL